MFEEFLTKQKKAFEEEKNILLKEKERQCDKAVQDYENDFIRFTEKMASDFCDRIAESDFPHNVGRMRHSCDFSVYKDKIFSDSGSFTFKKYLESDSEIISLSQAIAQSIKAKVEEKMDSFIGKDKTVTINDMQSIEEPQSSVAYMAYKE